jgi:hypothetical protein
VGLIIGIVITVLMFLFVPESPRFYVANGKPKEAMKVYKYLAKLSSDPNVKAKIDDYDKKLENVNLLENDEDTIPFKEQVRYFIKTRKRIFLGLIISLCWFINIL